jgi:hypothetical protein
MSEALIYIPVITTITIAILAALYAVMRNAPRHPQRQSYRRHRPWNFK